MRHRICIFRENLRRSANIKAHLLASFLRGCFEILAIYDLVQESSVRPHVSATHATLIEAQPCLTTTRKPTHDHKSARIRKRRDEAAFPPLPRNGSYLDKLLERCVVSWCLTAMSSAVLCAACALASTTGGMPTNPPTVSTLWPSSPAHISSEVPLDQF